VDARLDEGVFQVTVVVVFTWHREILDANLDAVKMMAYNLYIVKMQRRGVTWELTTLTKNRWWRPPKV
jgi:hypothetical protein